MPRKSWISVKIGILSPQHQLEIGPRIWLFLYLLDRANWDDGKVYGYTDGQTEEDIGIPKDTIIKHRRGLQASGYITCEKRDYDQTITIHNWTDPRKYSGDVLNPADVGVAASGRSDQSDHERSGGSDQQSDQQSDHERSVSLIESSKVKDQRPEKQASVEELSHKIAARQHRDLLTSQPGALPWEVPEHFRSILVEFCKVWTEIYGRKIMHGDRSKWINGAKFLHEEFGEGASEFILEAGKAHKKDDLSFNGPRSLHYAVRKLAYAAAAAEKEKLAKSNKTPVKRGSRPG